MELNSDEPPFIRRFAWRQMELIDEGYTEVKAFEKTDIEMKDEKRSKE